MPTNRPTARPPERRYTERSTRTSAVWTPTQTRAAYAAAEAGSIMRLADLVDAALEDDRVAGALGTRVRGLLGLPLDFESGKGVDDDPMVDALEHDFWRALPEAELAEVIEWGLMLGVGLAELRWEQGDDGRIVPRAHVWHPRWLRFDLRTETWLLSTDNAGDVPIDPNDPSWWLFTPYGRERPWRRAIVRALAPWWLLKRYAMQDWGTYGEAHGNPVRVATTPDGVNRADRDAIAADLQDIAGRTGMALPPGFDIKLVEATARTWETYQGQIDAANAGFAVAILGQTLTTEVKGGSFAAAKVHDAVRGDILAADHENIRTALHDGPVAWWAVFNFGVASSEAPWPRWDITPERGSQIFEYHLRAGVVTRNEVRATLGLPPFDGPEGDELLRIDGDPAAAEARAASRAVTLASGARVPATSGFVRGQLYVDGLAKRLEQVNPLKAHLRRLVEFVDGATSYQELADGLPGLFAELDPDDTAPLMEALMLADLAGQLAAHQDLDRA